jgi:hypothetical protein
MSVTKLNGLRGCQFANMFTIAPSTRRWVNHYTSLSSIRVPEHRRAYLIETNTQNPENITELVDNLGQIQTIAVLNKVLSQFKSKYYYTIKQNT